MLDKIYFTIYLYYLMLRSFFIRKKKEVFKKTEKSKSLKRILFLENQPAIHAGAYYRVEILKELLKEKGVEVDVHYPYNSIEFTEKSNFNKYRHHLKKKFEIILTASNYDLVIVRRELVHQLQYGNLFLEKLLLSVNSNVVLDMDDYMPDLRAHLSKGKNSIYNRLNFFNPNKNKDSFDIYKNYTLAIDEFRDTLLNNNSKVNKDRIHIFPMCLDYNIPLKKYTSKNQIVGWVSQSIHFKRIDDLVENLNNVYDKYPFELLVVADKPYENQQLKVPVRFKKWNLNSEQEDIQSFDIGIAPIDSNIEVKKRKGTFKLVQYMALGVVSLTTFMPYSEKLIDEGVNGFLINEEPDWEVKLLRILNFDSEKMSEIGLLAYETYSTRHSIDSQFDSLFQYYKNIIRI